MSWTRPFVEADHRLTLMRLAARIEHILYARD